MDFFIRVGCTNLKNAQYGKNKNVIDGIPGAYKNINTVMKNQDDLVEVVAELKQVVCVKG